MGSTNPFPTNKTAAVVNSVIDGVFNVAVTAAENAAIAEVPFLGLPVIRTIFGWVVEYFAGKLYEQTALFMTFEVIDFQVSGQLRDDQKALVALKAAQLKGDVNEIQSALDAFAKARAALTHLDGGASPGHM